MPAGLEGCASLAVVCELAVIISVISCTEEINSAYVGVQVYDRLQEKVLEG